MASSGPEKLTLYHTPTSFYSQKVRVLLQEKDLEYTSYLINSAKCEYYDPWFMKLNPKGQVPVVVYGEQVLVDSKFIMAALDQHFSERLPRFYPDSSTPLGQRVKQWEADLDVINFYAFTYGTYLFPDLTDIMKRKDPQAVQERTERIKKMPQIEYVKRMIEENPGMASTYRTKLASLEDRITGIVGKQGREAVITEVGRAGVLLDRIEEALEEQSKESPGQYMHLVGSSLTAADVCLFVSLHRLVDTGFSSQLWSDTLRPLVAKYYRQMATRPSFKEQCVDIR